MLFLVFRAGPDQKLSKLTRHKYSLEVPIDHEGLVFPAILVFVPFLVFFYHVCCAILYVKKRLALKLFLGFLKPC